MSEAAGIQEYRRMFARRTRDIYEYFEFWRLSPGNLCMFYFNVNSEM